MGIMSKPVHALLVNTNLAYKMANALINIVKIGEIRNANSVMKAINLMIMDSVRNSRKCNK